MSCIVINNNESKKFYILHNDSVKEIGYSANPIRFFREGVIFYEKIPHFSFFLYQWLWYLSKRRALYLPANNNMICKVRCEGQWWAWHIFRYIHQRIPQNCLLIIRENESLISSMLVTDGNLQKYHIITITELFDEFNDLPENIELCHFGLTELDIFQITRYDSNIANNLKEININIDQCKSFEEFIARNILTGFSSAPYTKYFILFIPVLITNICINVFYYLSISQDLAAVKQEIQLLKHSILFNIKLPKRINWSKLIYLLLRHSAIEKINIIDNKISIITNNPRKVKSILKKAGFTIVLNKQNSLALGQLIDSVDKNSPVKIEAIKND